MLTDALSGMPNSERFLQWATQNFYPIYVWHSIIDRRDAPRWKPEWISPDHLYAELVGRAEGVVQMVPEGSRPADWVSAIDAAQARLKESGKVLATYFPGPFDDFREAPMGSLTHEVFKDVESKLDAAANRGKTVLYCQ